MTSCADINIWIYIDSKIIYYLLQYRVLQNNSCKQMYAYRNKILSILISLHRLSLWNLGVKTKWYDNNNGFLPKYFFCYWTLEKINLNISRTLLMIIYTKYSRYIKVLISEGLYRYLHKNHPYQSTSWLSPLIWTNMNIPKHNQVYPISNWHRK